MFVHTNMVGSMDGETNLIQVKGKNNCAEIDCPQVAKNYTVNMNGFDKSDQDGHDNYVKIITNRWYLQIWLSKIERVVHCVYVVVCYVSNTGLRDDLKKYMSKHDGRKRLQLDLGIGLVEYGISLDWVDVNDKETKPDWMRQKQPKPCECGMFFFYK